MADLSSRVTIMAIGINKYKDPYLRNLKGPYKDIDRLRNTLTKNRKTAIYNPKQFIELRDPDAQEFRERINRFVLDRSADGDILILYFSGHGVAIGRDDFGFCTTDTIVHPLSKIALPLSVVKFSEILQSLNTASVIPIIIIDACYSGVAGKSLEIPPIEAISTIHDQVHTVAASSYALLCSCSELEPSIDTLNGGVFSSQLVEILMEGVDKSDDASILTLHDVFDKLSEKVLSTSIDTIPRLYLGPTLPKIPLALNAKFKTKNLILSPVYISILEALWNKGKPQSLSPDNIRDICGNGAYGNHNKLSLEPWQLVETIPNTRMRKLTKRGEQFMQNKLKVPKKINKDPKSQKMIDAKKTEYVNYKDFSN
jgi:hypothetical protein